MQKLLILLTLLSVGFAVPIQQEAVDIQELLAEIENAAAVEQEQAVGEDYKMAEIEQNTLRELLGSVLDKSNNYAQYKLNPDNQDPNNFKQLLGRVVNGVNNYAQNKLQPGEEQAYSEEEQAEIEQRTFRELLGGVLNGVNNYAQNRLNPDNRDPSNVRQLFGRFIGNVNKLVQRKLQRPRAQVNRYPSLNLPYPEEATIEQETLKELAREIYREVNDFLKKRLDLPTLAPDSEEVDQDLEADEQVISAILAPLAVSLLSNLAGRVFSG